MSIVSSVGHLELAAETFGEQLEISVIRGARVQTISVCLRSGRVDSDAEGWETVDLEPVPDADPPSGGSKAVGGRLASCWFGFFGFLFCFLNFTGSFLPVNFRKFTSLYQ